MGRIQWKCEQCWRIIEPNHGSIWTSDVIAMDHYRAHDSESVPWHVTCDRCGEPMKAGMDAGAYEIDINDVQFMGEFERWERHLGAKNWFENTGWDKVRFWMAPAE